MAQYAYPETLVETQWVAEHGNDPGIRLVEVDVDTTAYDQDHISGAIGWNGSWTEWGNMVRAPVEQGPEIAAL